MATVTKCDICGNTCDLNKSKVIRIHRVNFDGSRGGFLHAVDICPDCEPKVYEFLHIKEKKQ